MRWLKLDPATREAELRPVTLGAALLLHAVALAITATAQGAAAIGVSFPQTLIAVLIHEIVLFNNVFSAKLPLDHPWMRATVQLQGIINFALFGPIILGFTRDPESWAWVLYYAYVAIFSQAVESVPFAIGLVVASPLVAGVVLAWEGCSARLLLLPLFHAMQGVVAHLVLSSAAARQRRLREQRVELKASESRALFERERLQVAATLHQSLGNALRRALEATHACCRTIDQAGDVRAALRAMREGLRASMYELRALVWGLDPRPMPWPMVEGHLRRIASELCAPGVCNLESEVTASTEVGPADRVALLQMVRELAPRAGGQLRLVQRAGALELVTWEDQAQRIAGPTSQRLA